MWLAKVVLLGLLFTPPLALFTTSFLLSRLELTEYTTGRVTLPHRPYERVLWVIVDALGHEVVSSPVKFPALHRVIAERRVAGSAFTAAAHADAPTVTLQRLKGLTTGGLPAFVEFSSNFGTGDNGSGDDNVDGGGGSIAEDSLPLQWTRANLSAAVLGDDTWRAVHAGRFTTEHLFPSFDVADLHTVDDGIVASIGDVLREKKETTGTSPTEQDAEAATNDVSWSGPASSTHRHAVVVAHFLGLDHAGHTYGPGHPRLEAKIAQLDDRIARILDEHLDAGTVAFVMGDHGMTWDGNHGGATDDETRAAFVAIAGKDNAFRGTDAAYVGSGSRDDGGKVGDGGDVNTDESLRSHIAGDCTWTPHSDTLMSQIDFVPTFATLMGLPIPFSSLGAIVPELLPPGPAEFVVAALEENARQVSRYLEAYAVASGAFDAADAPAVPIEPVPVPQRSQSQGKGRKVEGDAPLATCRRGKELLTYLRDVQRFCRSMWTTFDVPRMAAACVAMALVVAAAVSSLAVDTTRVRPAPRCRVGFTVVPMLLLWIAACAAGRVYLGHTVIRNLDLAAATCGLFALLITWSNLSVAPGTESKGPTPFSAPLCGFLVQLVALGPTLALAGSMMSNSLLVAEPAVAHVLLGSTLLLPHVLATFVYFLLTKRSPGIITSGEKSVKRSRHHHRWIHSAAVSLSAVVAVSRFLLSHRPVRSDDPVAMAMATAAAAAEEEVQQGIVATSTSLVSLYSSLRTAASHLAAFSVPIGMLATWHCRRSPAVNYGRSPILYLCLITGQALAVTLFLWVFSDTHEYPVASLWLPRVVYILCIATLFHRAFTGPGCGTTITATTPSGYGATGDRSNSDNGSDVPFAIATPVCAASVALVGSMQLGASLAWVMPSVLFGAWAIVAADPGPGAPRAGTTARASALFLFSVVSFHATGQDNTFSRINWAAAFIGFRSLSFAVGGAAVTLATWCGPVVCLMCLAELSTMRSNRATATKGKTASEVRPTGTTMIAYLTIAISTAMVACATAAVHRRHLMVWSVFAPKFVFASAQFAVVIFVIVTMGACGLARRLFIGNNKKKQAK